MTISAPCPICNKDLQRTSHDAFDSWVCTAGHGLAATLSETYEVAQEDELERLWQLTRENKDKPGFRKCPMCAKAMVSIVVPYDTDEAREGEPGDTPDLGQVPVDVCEPDQVIWFDMGELEQFPRDLPDPEPTAEERAAIDKIRAEFGEALVQAADAREGLADIYADRVLHSAGVFGPLARAVSRK